MTMTIAKSLPEIVRRRRQELKITQVQIADALGFKSADYICLVEQGLRNLDMDKIPLLADVLQMDPVYLSKAALEAQYPVLAKCLLKDQGIKTKGKSFTEVDVALDRLRALPQGEQKLVINMVNALYSQKSKHVA